MIFFSNFNRSLEVILMTDDSNSNIETYVVVNSFKKNILSSNMKIYLELTYKHLFRLPRHLLKTENLGPA